MLLRGNGCRWKRCKFCDYHLDFSNNTEENFYLNKDVLNNVTGEFNSLEVINSGSFIELDDDTINFIIETLKKKKITNLTMELYYNDREKIKDIENKFKEVPNLKITYKTGIESFDFDIREKLFNKGIGDVQADEISKYFDDVCLLFGVEGQSKEIFLNDMKIAKKHFRRVCINIFTNNTTKMKEDRELIQWFIDTQYDKYLQDENVDILLENTDFGVGE